MNHIYSGLTDKSRFALTDFNCASFSERLGKGNNYKIIWARQGNITIGIDGYQIIVKKNHVLLCSPLNILDIEPHTEGAISFIFSKEFYNLWDYTGKLSFQDYLFQGALILPLVRLNEADTQNFELLFKLFKKEFERKDRFQGEMLMVLLKKLLIMFKRMVNNRCENDEIPNRASTVIGEFSYLVETHFRNKHQVTDYAELLHKSPKTISSIIKKHTKKTALSFINERILIEARRLLLFSDKTSEEIAYNLGYSEPGNFSKFFKKNVGTSPTQFRKRVFTPVT
ncbi:helix-turn-helix domain-containing protein [Spongiimicrobium sp. 2-473A-2-J]|uniref:helix-turn-helix domain-containing protein n=1 Tax=Eudoraea algarum TaxID=3417568 RepID=UPI003D370041